MIKHEDFISEVYTVQKNYLVPKLVKMLHLFNFFLVVSPCKIQSISIEYFHSESKMKRTFWTF